MGVCQRLGVLRDPKNTEYSVGFIYLHWVALESHYLWKLLHRVGFSCVFSAKVHRA